MTRRWARPGGRRAGVAVMTALAGLPILALGALAIDYAGVTSARARLSAAADSAALASVLAAANAYARDPTTTFDAAAQTGSQLFMAQAGGMPGLGSVAPSVGITRTGGVFAADVAYSATYQTSLAVVLGVPVIPLGGAAAAQVQTGPYIDVQVLMDTSGSMLIAATPDDITAMVAASRSRRFADPAPSWWPNGCAFACHWDPRSNDFYAASRTAKVTLRLDQLKAATGKIVDAMAGQDTENHYRFGLYTFSTRVAAAYPLTTDIVDAGPAVSMVPPPLADPNAAYDTNITESIRAFAAQDLTEAGDGSAPSLPRKYVFLFSDGIEDVYAPGQPSSRRESALDPAACDGLKAKGAVVAVVQTEFYNPDGEFADISAIQPAVKSAMQACASAPDLYFSVASQADLDAAVQAILTVAIATPGRISQ